MKICQILASRGAGGLERHFVDLCNGLASRHEVIAVAHPEFRSRLHSGLVFEPLDLSGWRYQPLSLYKLWRILRRHRPEIVHAQANKAAAMMALLQPLHAATYVATVHNLKRSTAMFRSYQQMIAVSRRAAAQLSHAQVEVIYNGIEPPAAPERGIAAESAAIAPSPVVIAVGRLVPAKGFDVLIEAWQGIDASLLIVGEGPERERLEKLIAAHNLGARVKLLGFREDVPALMAMADLMVIASRNEGFPYVLVEALHAKCIVVSTRVPGAEDVLPGEFLVPVEEPGVLGARITQVLRGLPAARDAYRAVWQRAAEELTLTHMVAQTEAVYRRALNR